MTRRKFSEREILETLAWQGVYVTCHRCKTPFFERFPPTGIMIGMKHMLSPEREHLHEIKLGGADQPYNCRYSCAECHKKITNGNKATSAGSSKHKIAKVKRILGLTKNKPARKIPSRPFPKKPKPDYGLDQPGSSRGGINRG